MCNIIPSQQTYSKKNTLGKTKIAMVALLVIGIIVANIPGLTVTHLIFNVWHTQSSNASPNNIYIKGSKAQTRGVVTGIATALIIGLPVFALGNSQELQLIKQQAGLLTVLLSGTVALIASRKRGAENG